MPAELGVSASSRMASHPARSCWIGGAGMEPSILPSLEGELGAQTFRSTQAAEDTAASSESVCKLFGAIVGRFWCGLVHSKGQRTFFLGFPV